MKLLSWMHHKFRQSTIADTTKHISIIGNSCTCLIGFAGHGDDVKRSYTNNLSNRDKDSDNVRVRTSHESDHQEDSVELFHGFLTIGTLGTLGTEPSTPTFSISAVEYVVEKEEEETMNDDVLENVLGQDDSCDASFHCRTITLSEELAVESGIQGQGHLFGSAIDTNLSIKKRQRTTLGELFEKSKHPPTKSNKESNKIGTSVMKKMLNKRRSSSVHSCPRSSASKGKKLHKILHIFNKKVHPEIHPCDERNKKHSKSQMKNNPHVMATDPRPFDEDIIIYPQRDSPSEGNNLGKNHNDDVVNEFWVNTDDDYLVLEL